jgi:hypothetical protein
VTESTIGVRARVDRGVGTMSGGLGPVAGAVGAVSLLALLGVSIGTNTPVGPRLPMTGLSGAVEWLALAGTSTAALLMGVDTQSALRRVAMLFAGVFGALSLVAAGATLPASLATVAAAGLLVASHDRSAADRRSVVELTVLIAFAVGTAAAMLSAIGLEPSLLRRTGSIAIAVGLAGLPVFTGVTRTSILVGLFAGTAVLAIGLSAPVLTAAISLLGAGVVGLPVVVLAVGAIGGTTAVAAGLEAGDIRTGLAGSLLLLAGVPATIPSALGALVGVSLLLEVSA